MSVCSRPVACLCKTCGQFHSPTDSHLYDYYQPIDDDLTCEICLQPLVDPVDTKCGHTFCVKCIKNFLKLQNMCPNDRNSLTVRDLQPASVIIRRLLDKLLVVCPNVHYCEEVLPRCDLEAHLIYRCPGAVVKCVRHEHGCNFQGPRNAMESHLWECEFRDNQDQSFTAPIIDGEVTSISMSRENRDLGMTIIGGCDTMLVSVQVQEVFPNSLISRDGRLKPGDQILQVNDVDLTQATHQQAKRALKQMLPTIKLTVYRDNGVKHKPIEKEDIIRMTLIKQPKLPLGIKLVGKKNISGVYIMELIPESIASLDGRLQIDDRLLEVNDHDLTRATQEDAANYIQAAQEKVRFVISRKTRPETPDILRSLSKSPLYSSEESLDIKKIGNLVSDNKSERKAVIIRKNKGESLGLSVAGGLGSQRGDTPLYVMNTLPDGPAHRCGIKKGDILLCVNGAKLLGISHNDAVQILKSKSSHRKVEMILLKTSEAVKSSQNFIPSWQYWLSLPSHCWLEREVKLLRCEKGGQGFSIVGGADSHNGNQWAYIKAVRPGSSASKHDLRCGDAILSINNHSTKELTHSQIVSLLKKEGTKLTLRVVSWPGTIV